MAPHSRTADLGQASAPLLHIQTALPPTSLLQPQGPQEAKPSHLTGPLPATHRAVFVQRGPHFHASSSPPLSEERLTAAPFCFSAPAAWPCRPGPLKLCPFFQESSETNWLPHKVGASIPVPVLGLHTFPEPAGSQESVCWMLGSVGSWRGWFPSHILCLGPLGLSASFPSTPPAN